MISPRSVWRRTAARQHRDPAANEPGDAAYTAHRVFAFIGLIVVVLLAVTLLSVSNQREAEQRQREDQQRLKEQQEGYEDCLDRIRNEDNWIVSPEEWCEGYIRPAWHRDTASPP